MKITVNKKGSTVIAPVVFEKEEWANAQEKAYVKLGKNVEVKGFRKGHAPLDQVKKHIEPAKMFDEAVMDVVNVAFNKILNDEKLDLITRPDYKITKISDSELEIEFEFTVKPEVTLGDYKGLSVEKEKATVKKEEVDARLAEVQKQYATVSIKDGEIAVGDVVKFDFEGFLDGKAFDGGKAENYELEIGSHQFVPGFEEQMVGLKAGDKKDIEITFPENYTKELAGKKAVFKLNIKEVSEKKLPELNDDLALDASIEGVNTLEELKAHLKEDIKHGKEHEVEQKAFDKLVETIVNASKVEIPEKVINENLDAEYKNFTTRVTQQGVTVEQYLEITKSTEESIKASMKDEIVKNLKNMFVLSTIAEKEKLNVTAEDMEKEYEAVAKQYGMEASKVKEALKGRENDMANTIFSRKISEFIKANNTIA